jgi:hypothetical protein
MNATTWALSAVCLLGCAEAPTAGLPAEDESLATTAELVLCGPKTSSFYSFTGTLPATNGAVIKCEALDPRYPGYLGYRVLYRTSTVIHQAGQAFEVAGPATGQVYIPIAAAAAPRWVLANTHGTTGIVAGCAPSFSESFESSVMLGALKTAVPGAVVVVPDYTGLGVDHGGRAPDVAFTLPDPLAPWTILKPLANVTHPYISIEGEGRATIDLVRAARSLPNASLGSQPKWFALGQSQGGHAALATAEVFTRGYGSELKLLGVVAGAPSGELDTTAFMEPDLERIVMPMLFAGMSLEWRDLQTSKLLSPQALAAFSKSSGAGCMSSSSIGDWMTINWLYLYPNHPVMRVDPKSDPVASAALLFNSPGHQPTSVPIFIGQVDGDPIVDARRTNLLVARERALNPAKVIYCVYPGTNLGQFWTLRAANHDSFGAMFGTGPSTCTGPAGQPVAISATGFLQALVTSSASQP